MLFRSASDVTFRAASTVNKYGYSVSYTDQAGISIADPFTGTADYGTSVQAPIATVTGYTSPATVQSITISDNEAANTVVYVYGINSYKVTYIVDNAVLEESSHVLFYPNTTSSTIIITKPMVPCHMVANAAPSTLPTKGMVRASPPIST